MGSGTDFIASKSWCCGGPSGEDGESQQQQQQQQRIRRTDNGDSQSVRRNPLRFGLDWLSALIVLILILHCDMVRAGQHQYAVIEAATEDQKSPGPAVVVVDGSERSEIYSANQEALSESNMQRIQDLVLRGLNITRIPRASEINISQKEYEEKYRLYLERLNGRSRNSRGMMSSPYAAEDADDNEETDDETDLHIMHTFRPNSSSSLHHRSRRSTVHKDLVFVRFPLPVDDKLSAGVDEATLRLMLVRHPNHQNHRHHHHLRESKVAVHVYQLSGTSDRVLLDTLSVDLDTIGERGKWIEFNVRSAVNSWIAEEHTNLGFEIHCNGCDKLGVQVIHEQSNVTPDFYTQDEEMDLDEDIMRPVTQHNGAVDENIPALNIVSRTRSPRGKRSRVLHPYSNRLHSRRPHHTKCEEHNGQKCCRSEMVVVFRDLKALDFIIQPKSFDAGHCRGKCPFNYNVASNHAYLQGMIWRQDRKKVPRPCCAPKKLEDLQVLHIDEQDPTKLKVSTWSEMRVLECACS